MNENTTHKDDSDSASNVPCSGAVMRHDGEKMMDVVARTKNIANDAPDVERHIDKTLTALARSAMDGKLYEKRKEGRGGWWDSEQCTINDLRRMLREHIEEGDMVDVMNFAAMIYVRECMALVDA